MNSLYMINLPYACFGIVLNENDIVVETAPIASWMKHKSFEEIKRWIRTKKGTIEKV